MKTTKLIFAFGLCVLFTINSYAQDKQENSASDNTRTIEIKVTGMTCAGCNSNLSNVLTEIPGVTDNDVKYPGDIAVVKYNYEKIKPVDIVKLIEKNTTYTAEIVDKKKSGKDEI